MTKWQRCHCKIFLMALSLSYKIRCQTINTSIYLLLIRTRTWLKRTFSARKCSKYDRFYSFILTWNQVNNIAWPKNSILLWKHANLRQTYVLSLVWLVYSWFHFRCRFKVQQVLKVVKNQEIGRKNKTKQDGTLFDHRVNSEIRIFAAFEIY